MPGVLIYNGGCLKDTLKLMNAQSFDCNWLITELECYDYCGWKGCEKWSNDTLFISNKEFLHDVNLRNMQFIWGIFSAIPTNYSKEQVLEHCSPSYDCNDILWNCKDTVYTQHPLSLVEISSEDSTFIKVICEDITLINPLYNLPDKVVDLEENNRKINSAFRRVDKILEQFCIKEPPNLKYTIWHKLFENNNSPIDDNTLKIEIAKAINK